MVDPRVCIPRCTTARLWIGKTLAASKASSDPRCMAYCMCGNYVRTDVHCMYPVPEPEAYTRTHADTLSQKQKHTRTTHFLHMCAHDPNSSAVNARRGWV